MLRVTWAIAALIVCPAHALEAGFSVVDDVSMAQIIGGYDGSVVKFSPDGRYFIAISERARSADNQLEDIIWLWRSPDVMTFLTSRSAKAPAPQVVARISGSRDGVMVTDLKWLNDSTGVAYLVRLVSGNHQLVRVGLDGSHSILTPSDEDVRAFDIRGDTVVYSVLSKEASMASLTTDAEGIRDLNGLGLAMTIGRFLAPGFLRARFLDLCDLWMLRNGVRSRVEDIGIHKPIHLHHAVWYFGNYQRLALSPSGRFVVAALPLEDIPQEWERYDPDPRSPHRLEPQRQDVDALHGISEVSAYFLIDLMTGGKRQLVNAPIGHDLRWSSGALTAVWASDERAVLLENQFLPDLFKTPCLAVVVLLQSLAPECVTTPAESSVGSTKELSDLEFIPGSDQRVVLRFNVDGERTALTYQHSARGWLRSTSESVRNSLAVDLHQDLNEPPSLVASASPMKVARELWNPNPQLNKKSLTPAQVMHWKDERGKDWLGGLIVPVGQGSRGPYPLVLLTHGFDPHEFLACPWNVMIARPLATSGIAVLQVGDIKAPLGVPDELNNQVLGYQGAIKKLVSEGIVDPRRIGIIGFSRTVMYVLRAIVQDALPLVATSVSDGVDGSYWQYLLNVDGPGSSVGLEDLDRTIGVPPFGDGFKKWLAIAPDFNADRMGVPLLILGTGNFSVLAYWGVYAPLRQLKKPVDLIDVGSGTHPLSNPGQRLAAEQLNLDWFRFWLQGYEDSAAGKASQYRRWEELCDMQVAQNLNRPAFCVRTKTH